MRSVSLSATLSLGLPSCFPHSTLNVSTHPNCAIIDSTGIMSINLCCSGGAHQLHPSGGLAENPHPDQSINMRNSCSKPLITHELKHGPLREWDPYSLNGIKGRVDQTDNACGEPGQTQHGMQCSGIEVDSGGKSWGAGQAFAAGESIKFRVAITANHGGIIELRYVCTDGLDKSSTLTHLDPYDKAPDLETASKCYTSNSHSNAWRDNDSCYRPRTLHRAVVDPASKTYHASHPEWYVLPKATASECMDPLQQIGGSGVAFDLEYQLPSSLASCGRVIVQWWYQMSNSCIPQAWREWQTAGSFPCTSSSWPIWSMLGKAAFGEVL